MVYVVVGTAVLLLLTSRALNECMQGNVEILVQAGKGERTLVKGTKEHMPVLKYGGWSHLFNTRRHLSPIF